MNKDLLKKYDTPYQKLIIERFADAVPDSRDTSENYSKVNWFFYILEAPFHYEAEDQMLQFANEHPKCTIRELDDYFSEIVPDGTLPPDADEWDDDEEDED